MLNSTLVDDFTDPKEKAKILKNNNLGCAQVNISGGGSATPPKISIPGAYSPSDPGVTVGSDALLMSMC